jgi:hypothetical protein
MFLAESTVATHETVTSSFSSSSADIESTSKLTTPVTAESPSKIEAVTTKVCLASAAISTLNPSKVATSDSI